MNNKQSDGFGRWTISKDLRKVSYSFVANGECYFGEASCDPEDEFNEETGKSIARLRALISWRKHQIRVLKTDRDIARTYLTAKVYDMLHQPLCEKIESYRLNVARMNSKLESLCGRD